MVKKLLVRFSAAFLGALVFIMLGTTGMASAAVSINVSGPGARVIVKGTSGDTNVKVSGPGAVVIVNSNHRYGKKFCHVQCWHNWQWCCRHACDPV